MFRHLTLALAIGLSLACGVQTPAATVTAVAAGSEHTVLLLSDGTVWCVGRNWEGQIGDGKPSIEGDPAVPVPVRGPNGVGRLTGIIGISAKWQHTVALKSDGTVWAWGYNSTYQLGDGTHANKTAPVQMTGATGVSACSAGGTHTVILKNDGTVWAVGDNTYGQLGTGGTFTQTVLTRVSGLTGVVQVSAGYDYTLARTADGSVYAWGHNDHGQLGDGTLTNRSTPTKLLTIGTVRTISAGYDHSIAVKTDGSVWTWGNNAYGQLGNGNLATNPAPVQVLGPEGLGYLTGAVSATANLDDSIVLLADGTVWGFGNNDIYQLGTNNETYISVPVQVPGLSSACSIAAGGWHAAAATTDGRAWVWGCNSLGQGAVGFPVEAVTLRPVVAGPDESHLAIVTGITQVALGGYHSLFLKNDCTVWGCGNDSNGQLGNASNANYAALVKVNGLSCVTNISTTFNFCAAVENDGSVWTWGENTRGQVGDGTVIDRLAVFKLPGLTGASKVSCGENHLLILKNDGTVWSLGRNDSGELGDGTTTDRTAPVRASGLSGVVAIAAGEYHSAALTSDGSVWTWGDNYYGQLGAYSVGTRLTPQRVSGLTNVVAIGVGAAHTIALKSDGTVWTFGFGDYGALGYQSSTYNATPRQIPGLTGVTSIAAGRFHTIVKKSDGTMWAWGWNALAQNGDGTVADCLVPKQISAFSGAQSAAAGYLHTIITNSDGSLSAVGYDSYGELGVGRFLASGVCHVVFDTTPPVGTFIINNGDAATRSGCVTLNISATDASGLISGMMISTDGVFDTETWQSYSDSAICCFINPEGVKTAYVKFIDRAGNESSVTSRSIMLDFTPPAAPTGLKAWALSATSAKLTWTAVSDAASYRIYGNGILVATSSSASWIGTGLATTGCLYYSVSAVDVAGNESMQCPMVLCIPWDPPIAQSKGLSDGSPLMLSQRIVTALVPGGFYVEEPDRSSGLRVASSAVVSVNDIVTVRGTIATTGNFERCLWADTVSTNGSSCLQPLGMTNKSLGGGPLNYDPLTGAGQRGVENGEGLNNIGLLIKTTGRVTGVGDDFFYIDDGTHAVDYTIFVGTRVICSGMARPPLGSYVAVTGISSITANRDKCYRCVQPRSASEIEIR